MVVRHGRCCPGGGARRGAGASGGGPAVGRAPAGEPGAVRSVDGRALQLGPLGAGRRGGGVQPDHAGQAGRSGGARQRGVHGFAGLERAELRERRRAVPGRVADDARLAPGRQRQHRLPVHPRARHDAPRRVRARLLRRQDVERVRHRRPGHDEGRRQEELHHDHEERHRDARRALRHPAAQGRALAGAGHAHHGRGPRGLGGDGGRQGPVRATPSSSAGGAGRARTRSDRSIPAGRRPASTTT